MQQQRSDLLAEADALDWKDLLAKLWAGRWVIVASVVTCGGVAACYALLATEIYRAEAVVQARQESRGTGGIGALAAQFGGLAEIGGLSMGGGGDKEVALATLRSRALIEAFIREGNLLPVLYDGQWDADSGKWKDPQSVPSLWRATNHFLGILKVSPDRKTGLVTVAIEWKDPTQARDWVTELIARTNAKLKARALEDGERNLAYLEGQARVIRQVELQQALFGLVEGELKKMMLAKGSDEFAFRTIDAAVVPEKRMRPKRRQIAVMGVLLGMFLGVVLVFIRDAWAREPDRTS